MGAVHVSGKLRITEDIMTDLTYTKISWVREEDVTAMSKKVGIMITNCCK